MILYAKLFSRKTGLDSKEGWVFHSGDRDKWAAVGEA